MRVNLNDVSLGYNGKQAFSPISGAIEAGSLTALIGPNGVGKSTLLKGLAGLLKPLSGEIDISCPTRIAYLSQANTIDRHFPATVSDLVSTGLWQQFGLWRRHGKAAREQIAKALATVGLDGFAERTINALSGGQLQRVLFARVVIQNADLILLDEPFNAMDGQTVSQLLKLIMQWRNEGRTVLVAVHDLELVKRYFPQTLLLGQYGFAWGPTQTVLSQHQQEKVSDWPDSFAMDKACRKTLRSIQSHPVSGMS
ncbi:zinc ABC transporter ATP-binding protein AztA [Bartonella sp. LJL80]